MYEEMDISKPLPTHIWVKILGKGTAVNLSFENVPQYCSSCRKIGHVESFCLAVEHNGRAEFAARRNSEARIPPVRNHVSRPRQEHHFSHYGHVHHDEGH